MLVHELKTPLTPLIVSSDFLVASLHEEPSLSFARNIQLGAANLSKRILELLDMARGEVGVLKLRRKKVAPVALIRNTFDYVLPEANHSQLEMKLDIPEHLPAIMADAGRIQQVLLNLLNNAFKFTRRGGEVVLKASTEANNVIFEVQDTGCGIDGKDQKYLFKPYSKKKPQKDNLGGLGLGLTLSKMLVELHEGKYERARRVKAVLSVFPFLHTDSVFLRKAKELNKVKILVIEDDQAIIETIFLSFQVGWPETEVVSTRLGEEGVEFVGSHNPDVVILDLGLPDINGFEVLKRIRLFQHSIVVLTQNEDEKSVIKALEYGADEYIIKPFRQMELLARISQ
jgi:CheY-like chemotaxis protein/anti-sigma regulatory factor (Ser/Thr protein kinase)